MSRPSKAELETALKQAAWLRENGTDEYFLGKSLLNHNYRIQHLEHVMESVKQYLHSGMSSGQDLMKLQKAIEAAEKADSFKGDIEPDDHTNVFV